MEKEKIEVIFTGDEQSSFITPQHLAELQKSEVPLVVVSPEKFQILKSS